MAEFHFFWGHDRNRLGDRAVLSQWYPAPFYSDGILFHTAEHWMMYQKAMLFGDDKIAYEMLQTPFPGPVKDLGRQVSGFDEKTWDQEKVGIVRLGNILKFSQSGELEDILLATGSTILVEASPYDSIWGIGLRESSKKAQKPAQWKGQNLLGYILMDVRAILSGETPTNLEDWT